MNNFFRVIAFLEGVSLLLLFFVAMPLKYIFQNPVLIRPIGMVHGLLFVVYILFAIMMKVEKNWKWSKFGIVCLASLIPFGTFYVEKKYLKNA